MSSNSDQKNEENIFIKEKVRYKMVKKTDDDNNLDDDDGEENLRFNSKLLLDVDKNDKLKKESIDLGIKFSIDYAPQQRIHEYLNNDLIKALDNNLSNPQTPITQIYNSNENNNNNNNENNGKYNIDEIPKIDLEEKEKDYNRNQTPLSLLKVNTFDYSKMKDLNSNLFQVQNNINYNQNFNNIIYNQNYQNVKEKQKKPFVIRAGDWNCFDCNNLNFAFRVKCNRCGLSKEISTQKYNMNLIKKLNLQSNKFYPQNFKKNEEK